MPLIQTQLTDEEDRILAEAAKMQRRSKREQLAVSALAHARKLVEDAENNAKAVTTKPKQWIKDRERQPKKS